MSETPNAEISLREVYDLVLSISQRLGSIPEDMHDHEARIRVLESRIDNTIPVADHETRVRSLERKVWGFAGAAAVLGAIGGNLLEQLGKLAG